MLRDIDIQDTPGCGLDDRACNPRLRAPESVRAPMKDHLIKSLDTGDSALLFSSNASS
jgi:hypothetical protein